LFPFFGLAILYIILIFLCLYYRNEQPLKSRGVFPLIACFFGIWSLVVNFTFFVRDFEWRTKYECYFSIISYTATIIPQLIILFLYSFRVTLTLQVKNNKNIIRNQNGKQTLIIKVINFLRFLTSDQMMIIVGIVLYIASLIVEIPFLYLSNWECANKIPNLIQVVFIPLICLAIAVVFIVDFFLVFKSLITCKCRRIFIDNDPFSLRIQQWIGATLTVSIISVIFAYIPIYGILTFGKGSSVENSSFIQLLYLVFPSLISIYFYMLIFYLIGLVLMITILQKLRNSFCRRKTKISNDIGLQMCLSDTDLKVLFKRYADSEWSSENYLLYFDIQQFKKMKESEQFEMALRIHRTYLNGSTSQLQVNLAQNVDGNIGVLLEKGEISQDMFDGVLRGVEENLRDTFSRFQFTKNYKNYMDAKKFVANQVL
jgi:hypothetical protein